MFYHLFEFKKSIFFTHLKHTHKKSKRKIFFYNLSKFSISCKENVCSSINGIIHLVRKQNLQKYAHERLHIIW